MFNTIANLFKNKQYEDNKGREHYLDSLSMLGILMLRKKTSEDQTRFLLDRLKANYNYDISLEELAYSTTDFIAKLNQVIAPAWLSFEFEKGIILHPKIRIRLIEQGFVLGQLGEDYHYERGLFIGIMARSLIVRMDLLEQLLSQLEYDYIIHKHNQLEPHYKEAHRILNEALCKTNFNIS